MNYWITCDNMKEVLKELSLDQLLSIVPISSKLNISEDDVICEVKKRLSNLEIKTKIIDRYKILQILGKQLFTNAKYNYRKDVGYSFFNEVFEKDFYDALVDGRIKECKHLFHISNFHLQVKDNNQLKLITFVEDQLNEIIEINY